MRYVPVVAVIIAGAIHWVIAPEHYDHSAVHGIFFAVVGLAEIVWAAAFFHRPTRTLFRAGAALAGGLVVLWALTRVLPAPFGHGGPEPVDARGGLACKASELIGLLSLIAVAWQGRLLNETRRPLSRIAAEALALALVVGLGTYGVGYAASAAFPAESPSHHDHPTTEAAPKHDHGGGSATLDHLQIEKAWARAAHAGDTSGAFLTIANTGDHADALIAVHFDGAEMAEVYESRMEGDVIQMRPAASLEIPAGGTVELKPGGYHIMLMNLKHDLTAGDHVSLTLEFEHGGQVAVEAEVVAP